MKEQQSHGKDIDERLNDNGRPTPYHGEKNVHEKLQLQKRQPVGPVGNNSVQQVKQAGRHINGVLIVS